MRECSDYEYWRNGMFVRWRTGTEYFLVCTLPHEPNEFHIVTTGNQMGHVLIGNLVDLIDNLIEEWYPGKCIHLTYFH